MVIQTVLSFGEKKRAILRQGGNTVPQPTQRRRWAEGAGGSGRLGEAAAADPVGFSYPGEGIVTKSQNQIG